MSLYATNTQFTPQFWVDMRYRVAYINELAAIKNDSKISLNIIILLL